MARSALFEARVTKEEAERTPYLYLPFDLPQGTTRLDVTLEHDEGNVIDLGIFDPRARPFPSLAGFRGWSGGARDHFFVALDGATPGYLPGEMPVGTWQVILGLYDIKPRGCSYRVEVTFDCAPRQPVSPAPRHPAFAVEPGWYPGDLQSHTHHSDARGSVDDLARAARARGLRFLAVTDHNTVSHHRQLAQASSKELFLLPGEEITTAKGHANVWGASDWVDFRIAEDDDVGQVVRRAQELGGVVSINHPKSGGPPWLYPVPDEIDCVEAWQAAWPAANDESLAFYDDLLRSGKRPVLVGGSDRHQPGWPDPDPEILQVGSPTTWLWLEELSVAALLRAIRSGRIFVSGTPSGPRLELSVEGVPMGSVLQVAGGLSAVVVSLRGVSRARLRLVGEFGVLLEQVVGAGDHQLTVDPSLAGRFLRAELHHDEHDLVLALTNPVHLQPQLVALMTSPSSRRR